MTSFPTIDAPRGSQRIMDILVAAHPNHVGDLDLRAVMERLGYSSIDGSIKVFVSQLRKALVGTGWCIEGLRGQRGAITGYRLVEGEQKVLVMPKRTRGPAKEQAPPDPAEIEAARALARSRAHRPPPRIARALVARHGAERVSGAVRMAAREGPALLAGPMRGAS